MLNNCVIKTTSIRVISQNSFLIMKAETLNFKLKCFIFRSNVSQGGCRGVTADVSTCHPPPLWGAKGASPHHFAAGAARGAAGGAAGAAWGGAAIWAAPLSPLWRRVAPPRSVPPSTNPTTSPSAPTGLSLFSIKLIKFWLMFECFLVGAEWRRRRSGGGGGGEGGGGIPVQQRFHWVGAAGRWSRVDSGGEWWWWRCPRRGRPRNRLRPALPPPGAKKPLTTCIYFFCSLKGKTLFV